MTLSAADLRDTAAALLDGLDPADAEELLSRRPDRDALLDALAALAVRATQDLARRGVDVPAEQHRTLLLGCLSLRPGSHGVKARPDRAAETYLRFLPLQDADPRDLIPVAADHPADLEALVALLTRARAIRDGLAAAGVADPPFFVEPVALAVAAAPQPDGAPLVARARQVLEHGAALAREHAESGRRAPATELPIVGNADFLVRLAGYRIAMTGHPTDQDPLDAMEPVLAEVSEEIATAMTRPTGIWARLRAGEPDVFAGTDRYLTGLGDAVGGAEVGRLVRLAYTVRTRHARPRRADRTEHAPVERLSVPDGTAAQVELHELAARLVAGLFERADPRLRGPLLDWLRGRRVPDQQEELAGLLRMLRVGVHRMAEHAAGTESPPVATGLSPADYAAVLDRLTTAVHPDELTGDRRSDAHRIIHIGLPPLWTRRGAAIRMLAAARRARQLRGDTQDRRTAFFRAGTRAPVQYFQPVNERAAGSCCAPEAGANPGRSPAAELVPCPHRPWGEIGVLDTYGTVSRDTELSPEAVRKYYARYRGPDRELLLGVRATLQPEDC